MKFTHAEKRRPINFRELLGIVRVVEIFGHRMRGCQIMIETDNTAAKGAAEKLASTAASMQEMLRRLYALAERHDITVKLIHTPGAKLFRPDQTSRGDPIEEPRVRLRGQEFALFEARFGPFTECVGAERRFPITEAAQASVRSAGCRLWVHPAHNTVGSALRLVGERMAGYDGDDASHLGPPPSGVVIVPFAPEAHWWSLVKHFVCVGRWEAGSAHLEMNQLGAWKEIKASRPSMALAFPRTSGNLLPVEMQEQEFVVMPSNSKFRSSGYVDPPDKLDSKMLPLPLQAHLCIPRVRVEYEASC